MEKVLLSDSSLLLSKFIFGTSRIHKTITGKARQRILSKAVECGFTHFDTSPLYGYGIAESEIGCLAKRNPNITVTTKYGLYPPGRIQKQRWDIYLRKASGKLIPLLSKAKENFDTARAHQSLVLSLKRINRDYVDLFMLHEPPENIENYSETLDFLLDLKSQGLIREFGVAGRWSSIKQFYLEFPDILKVIQIQDEEGIPLADLSQFVGGSRVITYGYGALSKITDLNYLDRIRYGLARNTEGAIIVSTSNLNHIGQYERLFGRQHDL